MPASTQRDGAGRAQVDCFPDARLPLFGRLWVQESYVAVLVALVEYVRRDQYALAGPYTNFGVDFDI